MAGSIRFLSFLFLLLQLFPPLDVKAQNFVAEVVYRAYAECADKKDPRNNLNDVKVSVFMDGKSIHATGGMVADGGHYLRVNVAPKEGYESNKGSFYIKKIEWERCTAAIGEPPIISQIFSSAEATLLVNIDKYPGQKNCYRVVIYVEKCGGVGEEKETNIKVITTESYTSEKENPVSDVTVQIGDKLVNIDEDGIGFLKIRPDQYQISISRKKKEYYSSIDVEYIKLRSLKTKKIYDLKAKPRQTYSSVYEVNIPVTETGSGGLYDFELHINMVAGLQRGLPEARIVAVQPSVEVHKAGTSEDAWVPARVDMVLQAGDEISCDPDGAATLQFADMSTTVVKNTTQLKIASYFTEGGVVKTEILLKMGEVAAQIHKSEATKSDFRIKSPGDGGSVRGTVFSYKYDPALQSSTIKVEEGLVEVSSNNAAYSPVMVKAGQQIKTYPNSIGKPEPFTGKIDFNLPKKKDGPRINVKDPLTDISGTWEITQGTYKGILTLVQNGTELSGQVVWNNHQKGIIDGGDFLYGFISFAIAYDGDLKGNYHSKLDDTGKKMIEGKGLSNKGTESTWSAVRQ